ncbi:transcription termination factor 3, mitochondrial [Oryzias melastigma]|uniref:Transcription termination factor 3, mitochondrial n=1 Tax=Oryzias melastigma TaxID=30732 RepID=A0A3B3DFC8_ORYME|nr:transcription termination factor 3, mitochondrial [Oryzias melastigma]
MASACGQLCMRCSLSSKTAIWQCYYHVRHFIPRTRQMSKSFDGLFITKSLASTQTRLSWKLQMRCYSDLAEKHLSADAKDSEHIRELTKTDTAKITNTLMPSTGVQSMTEHPMFLDLDDAGESSALEEICDEEAISISIPTSLPPVSTSLRDYVEKSETLTKLVQLGVNLWKLEQRPNVGSMLLRLDFKTDVVPRLMFLKEMGVEDSRIGYIISHNPFILSESIENLRDRVSYLKSRKFSSETVASMVSRAPYLLNFNVKRLDNRLGFYQQQLQLSASNTRNIVARLPRLLCVSLEPIKENLKVCEIELGFKKNEIQHIVLAVPKVLTANKRKLTQIFDYIHNTMKVPHYLITKFPQILNTKYLRVRERHLFLEYLQKAQYDPSLPNYISLDRLVSLPDEAFCTELALATVEDFYLFQKTL